MEDWRHLSNGTLIPAEKYSDQPYILKTDDGAWLCAMTTGPGHEGSSGQHIITQRSMDYGQTWIDQQNVEPNDGPEASYAVLLKGPSGRVFVFYNHNTDNLRAVQGDGGRVTRVDSQGYYVFKYSDDHGKTWSSDRIPIPVRAFEIDRKNVYQGSIRFFWNVGKAFIHNRFAYVPLIKVGGFGEGFFTSTEGVLLKSGDLLYLEDPSEATWTTLPDGDIGLRTPPNGGPIAEEQSYSILSDGSFYCVYRTIDGYPAYTYSRDGGHTWDTPQYLRYANGRLVKNPRAANFIWKCENGKFLYWFHNHGGRFIREHAERRTIGYEDRNPGWLAGGIENDSGEGKVIEWTQPEIVLYDDDPMIRMSYPDLIEDRGHYYLSETQKRIARVHRVDERLLEMLWAQFDNQVRASEGIVLDWTDRELVPRTGSAPQLHEFNTRDTEAGDYRSKPLRTGFTVDIAITLNDLSAGQDLVDARNSSGEGWCLRTAGRNTVEILLSDGRTQSTWACDEGMLKEGQSHYLSVIVDGGPGVIIFVVDGVLNDGGEARPFGWGRFNTNMRSASAGATIQIVALASGSVQRVAIYDRAILVSEAIGNNREFARKGNWRST